MPTCRGTKKDGTTCESRAVMANGYCYTHQDQAPAGPIDVADSWTRERLEAAIEAAGGPERLNLMREDLSGLDLSEMDLHGIRLLDANLRGVNLSSANLQQAVLNDSDLERAILTGTALQNAHLLYTQMPWADLHGASLKGACCANAHFLGADLSRADLRETNANNANMVNAKLAYASLSGSTLQCANLNRANLDDAFLQSADLTGAGLFQAKLRRADLRGALLPTANLAEADLTDALLTKADLQKAILIAALFERANLVRANMQGSRLDGATLTQADLKGAYLRDIVLSGASLQEADLRFADLTDVDLLNARQGGLLEVRFYRAKLDRTLLRKEQLGPATGDEFAGEYREARDAYLSLKQNFESLGDYDGAAWAYVKERHMERKCSAPRHARRFYGREQLGDADDSKFPAYHPRVARFYLRHTAKYINDMLQWWACGYGERPWHTVVTMVLVFALFVALYWATRCVGRIDVLPDGTETIVPTRDLLDIIVFSLGAFTTMDASRLVPRAPIVEVLMGAEALLGIGLTGLLGFVIGNRIRRS